MNDVKEGMLFISNAVSISYFLNTHTNKNHTHEMTFDEFEKIYKGSIWSYPLTEFEFLLEKVKDENEHEIQEYVLVYFTENDGSKLYRLIEGRTFLQKY